MSAHGTVRVQRTHGWLAWLTRCTCGFYCCSGSFTEAEGHAEVHAHANSGSYENPLVSA